MGLIMENSNPGTSDEYLTPPEGEAEAETSGVEANMEKVEDPLQGELNSPMEETKGYSVDPWLEVDQALEEVFNQEYKDWGSRRDHPYGLVDKITGRQEWSGSKRQWQSPRTTPLSENGWN